MGMAGVTIAAVVLAAGSARRQSACRTDVERLCQGIQPGGGRILACLKANQAHIAPQCKDELASIARMVNEIGSVCEDDIQSYCASMKAGEGAVLRCLATNEPSIAPGCQEVIQGAQEKFAEFRKACGADEKRFCKGIPPGEGRILACLKSKEHELAPACRALMK